MALTSVLAALTMLAPAWASSEHTLGISTNCLDADVGRSLPEGFGNSV